MNLKEKLNYVSSVNQKLQEIKASGHLQLTCSQKLHLSDLLIVLLWSTASNTLKRSAGSEMWPLFCCSEHCMVWSQGLFGDIFFWEDWQQSWMQVTNSLRPLYLSLLALCWQTPLEICTPANDSLSKANGINKYINNCSCLTEALFPQ